MLGNSPVYAVLPCVDMAAARQFYAEVLGLKEVKIPGLSEENRAEGALFECGKGTQLFIYRREVPTKAEHTAAGWLVNDIEAVVDELSSKGVRMEVYDMLGVEFDERGIATAGDMKSAWFKDPEGNILAINQIA